MQQGDEFEKIGDSETEVDALDLKIIHLLQQDGRTAYSQISRELGIPEATVRYRVNRLLDEGVITISAFLNTGKFRYANVGFIEMEVTSEFFETLLKTLVDMNNISYITAVTGEYNVILEYVYQDNNDFLDFTTWLQRQPTVIRLTTRVLLKIFKAQYPIRVADK